MIYLRLGIDRVEEVTVVAVPDPDAPVGGAAARGEHARLPGAPSHRLHCRLIGRQIAGVVLGLIHFVLWLGKQWNLSNETGIEPSCRRT